MRFGVGGGLASSPRRGARGCGLASGGTRSTLLDGLLGYWSLEGSSLNSVTGLTGTDTAVTYAAGKVGLGAVLNGSTSRIDTEAAGPQAAADFTLACWALATDAVNYRDLLHWGSGGGLTAALERGAAGNLYVSNYAAAGPSVPFSTGAWHYVVLTRTESNVTTLRVDAGAPVTQVGYSMLPTAAPIVLGAGPGPARYWAGSIDEVGVWGRALTAGEEAELYNAGAGRAYPF